MRGPRAINNLEWERDREEYLPTTVGELYGTRRETRNWRVKLLALGEHRCGTDADFAGDGVCDPSPPYVSYRPDHLPTCCGAAQEGDGGGVGSGSADVVWAGPDPSTCITGVPMTLGLTYSREISFGQTHWYTLPIGINGASTLYTTGIPPGSVVMGFYLDPLDTFCTALVTWFYDSPGPPDWTFTANGAFTFHFAHQSTSLAPYTYTMRVTQP